MNPFPKSAVLETLEFQRIRDLPRRVVTDAENEELAALMTKILRRPDSPCGSAPVVKGLCSACGSPVALRPIQGRSLAEIAKGKKLFGAIRVGGGKTLLSLLVPFVVNARRPVLLIPASLKEKTERNRAVLARHWRIGSNLRILTYEELGRETRAHEIDFYRPDALICDEGHRLKNLKAGVTRRWLRYTSRNPLTKKPWEPGTEPMIVIFSGTMLKGGTIKSFAHLLQKSHRIHAPVPLENNELDEWASALDESTNFTRPHPGPILKLATSDDDRVPGDDLATARRAFRRRLLETEGIVSTAGEQVANCSIYIRPLWYEPNEVTEHNFRKLRGSEPKEQFPGWETPDGWPLSMATEVWRVARELALGFHGVWDPRPPQDWIAARKEWAAFVRDFLSRSRTFDTEGQVKTICENGGWRDESNRWHPVDDSAYRAWDAVKDTFKIIPKDVWHDTSALEACEAWMKKGPGLVWVKHVFFGEELARRTGAPYFRENGNDASGRNLEAFADLIRAGKAKPCPIIVSADACKEGFNLQPWSRNLLVSITSDAGWLEQVIGRTHRDGQESDQVEVDIMIACVEIFEAWGRALAKARMAVDVLGDSQKILIADSTFPVYEYEIPNSGPRWTKTRGKASDDDSV